MVIIRDIVNDFSDDEDIELCCDDEEDLELDSSELANITYGHIYCEELTKVLNENNRKATCQTIRTFSRESGVFVVEVPGREGSRHSKVYTVRLNQYWCECGEFQSLRLSCSHVIATCSSMNLDYRQFISLIYRLDNLLKVYGREFEPIGNEEYWPHYSGPMFTGPTNMDWNVVCHNLLGAVPNERQIVGQRIQISWLDSTFQQLPDDVTEIVIDQHARAFILRMIGGFLMPDTSGSRVHLMYLLLLEDLSKTYQYSCRATLISRLCRAAFILQYNFIRSIRDQGAPSTVHDNPMQFIHGVYLQCNEMIDAFAKLLPTAFSDSNYQAPPTMSVAPEFQQPFESQTQTDTHPHAFTQQTPVSQQPFQFQSFGALSDYSISHQFRSSSHYEESLPTMFGTTSTKPLSAFNSEQYYQPTMPTQVDDEEEEEEMPQLVRGGTRQPTQPSLRVQPPRRKRPPPCGISSHRRH
ncbi:hypothetical protein Lal_00019363 [Lupinus albus]|nr:hypothetical protein Lal_00019363 [Lupinus albus]